MKKILIILFFSFLSTYSQNNLVEIKHCYLDGVVIILSSTQNSNEIKLEFINNTDLMIQFPSMYFHYQHFTMLQNNKKGTNLYWGYSSLIHGTHLSGNKEIKIDIVKPGDTLSIIKSGIEMSLINQLQVDFIKRMDLLSKDKYIKRLDYSDQAQYFDVGLIW